MKSIWRILIIGTLHSVCYLWLLPSVILPRFGNRGTRVTVTVLGVISVLLLSGLIRRGSARLRLKKTMKED